MEPCRHTFCKDCIFRWLEKKSTCPLCLQIIATGTWVYNAGLYRCKGLSLCDRVRLQYNADAGA